MNVFMGDFLDETEVLRLDRDSASPRSSSGMEALTRTSSTGFETELFSRFRASTFTYNQMAPTQLAQWAMNMNRPALQQAPLPHAIGAASYRLTIWLGTTLV
jgi:hypothetical protein